MTSINTVLGCIQRHGRSVPVRLREVA